MPENVKPVGVPENYPVKPGEIDKIPLPKLPDISKGVQRISDVDFKDLLLKAIDSVNRMQIDADKAAQELAKTNNLEKIPEVLIKMRKAEISFNALLQIRNKIIEAYQELQRMNI